MKTITLAANGLRALMLSALLITITGVHNVQAQVPQPVTNRTFPASTQRGDVTIQDFPNALLNGSPVRFAPGARIWDMSNLLILPGALGAATYRVNYTVDFQGMFSRMWILTDAEIGADVATQISPLKQ